MSERILSRLGAASGALFVVFLFGASSTDSDAHAVIVVELVALLLFVPFLGYLWQVLRAAEGSVGWLSMTALAAGLVAVAIKLGSIAPGWAARHFADGTPTHQALEDMNSVAFIATMLPLGVMLAAVAVLVLRTRVLPRWLGWLAAVAAPALVVNGMFLDAEFGPAFLLFSLWTLLASAALALKARPATASIGSAASSSAS